jgi:hypothetical protein
MKIDLPNPIEEQIQVMKIESLKKLVHNVSFELFERTEELPSEEEEETNVFYNEELKASGENS